MPETDVVPDLRTVAGILAPPGGRGHLAGTCWDAVTEIEALRSVLRALDVRATSLDMGGHHHYSGRGYLTPEQQVALRRALDGDSQ